MTDAIAAAPDIRHEPDSRRFAVEVDGHQGYVEYELQDGAMVIIHTIVPSAIGGRGVAGALVKAAIDHARSAGLKVAPQCSYAETWMRRHPDYHDLHA